jgi:hypothetical protein
MAVAVVDGKAKRAMGLGWVEEEERESDKGDEKVKRCSGRERSVSTRKRLAFPLLLNSRSGSSAPPPQLWSASSGTCKEEHFIFKKIRSILLPQLCLWFTRWFIISVQEDFRKHTNFLKLLALFVFAHVKTYLFILIFPSINLV